MRLPRFIPQGLRRGYAIQRANGELWLFTLLDVLLLVALVCAVFGIIYWLTRGLDLHLDVDMSLERQHTATAEVEP